MNSEMYEQKIRELNPCHPAIAVVLVTLGSIASAMVLLNVAL